MPEYKTDKAAGGQRTGVLSEPIENLIQDWACDQFDERCDVLIVGSGYGGAIAAMRLAGEGRRVFLFERGKEYVTGDFPETIQGTPGHIQFLPKNRDLPIGSPDALFDFRLDTPVSVLVGNGLGGGSLINANVALEPEGEVFNDCAWPQPLYRNPAELQSSFQAVRALLGVTTYKGSSKYAALQGLAASLGLQRECHLAPITVTEQSNRLNRVNILQNACIGCGNCVTGCNIGAKNTLPMNALPLARSRGASLYTGATVLSVEPDGPSDGTQGWNVRFLRTATSKTVLHKEVFTLHAQVVILAAGTLGSTEILLRSKRQDRVQVSERLGERFSTNVDALAFGYAQEREVNAVATVDAHPPPRRWRDIGPTITGYIRANIDSGGRRRVTIQDGAVPSALAHLFGEVLATASVFKRNTKIRLPAWFRNPANCDRDGKSKDPLSVHPGALDHSQVLLVQGDDEAQSRLELKPCEDGAPDDPDYFRIRICKPPDGEPPRQEPAVFDAVDRLLEQGEKKSGFDGGDYLPNPFWKVLPSELSQVSNLPPPGKNLLTVHPLGGCPMGNDVNSGVVNHYGQVFRSDGSLYEGLYVMDGAIMPCALSVNPFLTIAALAYRNAEKVGRDLNWKVQGIPDQGKPEISDELKQAVEATLPNATPTPPELDSKVKGTFVEFMTGPEVPPWLIERFGVKDERLTRNQNRKDKLVLKVEINIDNVMVWLSAPSDTLTATATLYANTGPINPVRGEKLVLLGDGTGKVTLLAWDRPCCWLQQAWRMVCAMWAFYRRRGAGYATGMLDWSKPREVIKVFVGFLRVGWNHANWRQLDYDFTFQPAAGPVELKGTKELAYSMRKRNPWTALTELPFTLGGADGTMKGLLDVDLVKLTQRAPFQASAPTDSPSIIAAMSSAGMMFLRVLFQTHFWSFGAPNYPEQRIKTNREPEPIRIEGSPPIEGRSIPLPVRVSDECPERINLRLVHYERKTPSTRGSILLIHGLASGSRVFATDSIEENFSTYLYKLGYDVWLFDYRVSIALPPLGTQPAPSELQSDMDQIAKYDMHEAVQYVYEQTGGPIQVFAHCVGAASLAMAILSGRCHDGKKHRPMISALALHAVAPWPVPSALNHMKANFAAFFKDALAWKRLDAVLPPSPQPGAVLAWDPNQGVVKPFDVMMDRIAGSIPFPASLFSNEKGEARLHRKQTDPLGFGKNICDRMTLFYGWEWNHDGLAAETHRKLADLVGVANFETFRHIYFLLTRKRLTTRMGEDVYVKDKNFERYWTFPTLFAHGRDNQLYDPRSAIASCLRLRSLRRPPGVPENLRDHYDVYWFEASPCGHFDFLFGKEANKNAYPSVSAFFEQARIRLLKAQGQQVRPELTPKEREKALTPEEDAAWGRLLQRDLEVDRDPYWGDVSQIPYRGPIIGWARRENGKSVFRLWIEPYRFSATTPSGIESDIEDLVRIPLPTVEPVRDPHRIKHPFPTKQVEDLPVEEVDYPFPAHRNEYPGTYWVYDVELPGEFKQDLRISVDYPAEAQKIRVRLDPVEPLKKLEDTLHDPKKGARIPLTTLPWFNRLQQSRDSAHTAFLVGSCRYPGSPFDALRADRVFQGMQQHVPPHQDKNGKVRQGVDHVLFVGDQIYADATADVFDTRELRERFAGQYRDVFGTASMRRLLASVPVYMALDDHEFDDNWPGDADNLDPDDPLVRKSRDNFQYGLAAAMAYQWSMSPQNGWPPPAPSGWPTNHDSGIWYHFESGGLPFFVMDTRTERRLRQAGVQATTKHSARDTARLVSQRQLVALKQWLSDAQRDKPKFIVSGSVLAPVETRFTQQEWLYRNYDGWAGYPETWRELVQHIVEKQIQKVVFIAGDYHFSALAELTLSAGSLGNPVRSHQIVSSGLFVPLEFSNARAEEYGGGTGRPSRLPFSNGDATIEVVGPDPLCEECSHFLRVDAEHADGSKWTLRIGAYDCDGVELKNRTIEWA